MDKKLIENEPPNNFHDLFDFFGGGYKKGNPQHGADILKHIQIQLEDAVNGQDRELDLLHSEPCTLCIASGIEKKNYNTHLGVVTRAKTCTQCGGTGYCHVARKISIRIPAGIKNGMQLRIKGYGESGVHGGENGDLLIEVHVP